MLPLVRPGLAVVATITVLAYRNDLFWPLTEPSLHRLAARPCGALWAGLPVIVAFLFFQRHIIEGLTASAVK